MISLHAVGKRFGQQSVLKNVNLSLRPKEFLTILGPSGCGKSTLLRILSRLEEPTSGKWEGPSLREFKISFVFQDPELLPWRTLSENVTLPLELLKQKADPSHCDQILSLVQLNQFKGYYPDQLSGGMKMRASIARALITEPDLLLMDEPFSALDESTRFEMQNQLLKLKKIKKMTVVFVTHSISEAAYLSDRIQVFSTREGCSIHEERIHFSEERTDEIRSGDSYRNYVTKLSELMKKDKQKNVYGEL